MTKQFLDISCFKCFSFSLVSSTLVRDLDEQHLLHVWCVPFLPFACPEFICSVCVHNKISHFTFLLCSDFISVIIFVQSSILLIEKVSFSAWTFPLLVVGDAFLLFWLWNMREKFHPRVCVCVCMRATDFANANHRHLRKWNIRILLSTNKCQMEMSSNKNKCYFPSRFSTKATTMTFQRNQRVAVRTKWYEMRRYIYL